MTNDPRLAVAIEAAARTMHMLNKERHQFRWENASDEWRAEVLSFVTPLVEAALKAADDYVSLADRDKA